MDNLNIGDENKEEVIKQNKKKNATLFVVFIVAVLIVLFLVGFSNREGRSITEKNELQILDELVKNSDSNKYTEQEKKDILKNLSETNKESQQMTTEEKIKSLNSLTK